MKHTRKWLLLKLLEDAGNHGATTADLLNAGIGSRYGARVLELREDGYTIRSVRERDGSYRYTLLDSPEPERGISTPEPSPGEVPPSAGASLRVGDVESGRGEGSPSDAAPESLAGSGHSTVALSPDRLFDPPSEPTGHWRAA